MQSSPRPLRLYIPVIVRIRSSKTASFTLRTYYARIYAYTRVLYALARRCRTFPLDMFPLDRLPHGRCHSGRLPLSILLHEDQASGYRKKNGKRNVCLEYMSMRKTSAVDKCRGGGNIHFPRTRTGQENKCFRDAKAKPPA